MPLKDLEIKAIKPRKTSFKKADGKGLYIEVFPNGSKLWRLKFRFAGKEKRLALGSYPEVSLAEARKRREDARAVLEKGSDPSMVRKHEKAAAKVSAENSFARVAVEYVEKTEKEGRAPATVLKARYFLSKLEPAIGSMPVRDIDPQMLLAALKKLESEGKYETAKKTRSFASRVFRFAVATTRASGDPASILTGALTSPKAKNYAAIIEPHKLGELLRAIDSFTGGPITQFALKIQ